MRVSVTLSDDVNKLITEQALERGMSKDRLIGSIVETWLKKSQADFYREKMALKQELDELKAKKHNERGAGRKQQYGDAHKLAMQAYKANGLSYREIAKIYDCSVATVHKLINEQD